MVKVMILRMVDYLLCLALRELRSHKVKEILPDK